MTKSRTVLMVILSLVLAALIAAAAVLGTALSRSAYSDSSEAYAGEARWKVTEKTVGEIESVTVPMEKIRPEYKSYEAHIGDGNNQTTPSGPGWGYTSADPGIRTYESFEAGGETSYTVRTSEFFGVVATLRNDGDVKAAVTISVPDEESLTFDTDGCGINDQRYGYDEIAVHFECELYWSKVGTYETKDAAKSGRETSNTLTLEAGGDDVIYFYAYVKWITDLEYDMGDGVHVYDGVLGDEFDTWAGEHLTGITFRVDIECTQAE